MSNPHSNNDHTTSTIIAQQLLDAYFMDWGFDPNKRVLNLHIHKMASILTSNDSLTIKSFMELRSKYIGITNTKTDGTTNNNNHSNEDIIFNYSLFHAALLTNSPTIIDIILQYIPFDFNILNIPYDQTGVIKKSNAIHNYYKDAIYPNNYILVAIVDATQKGHHQSIQHLINNYHLSPTIPICDCQTYQKVGFTNLLYYASSSTTNINFIQYLLPLCFPSISTNTKLISSTLGQLAEHGHLDIIQTLHNTYNININCIDPFEHNILYYAAKSNNIELIDYLIEVIGINLNESDVLNSSIIALKWNTVKYFITKYNINIEQEHRQSLLQHAPRDTTITPDIIDELITLFNLTLDDINGINRTSLWFRSPPLFDFAANENIMVVKHLIEKYNANPSALYEGGTSISHHEYRPSFEMVEYLCTLSIDANQRESYFQYLIELATTPRSNIQSPLYMIELPLKHGAKINDIHDITGKAMNWQQMKIVQYLLERYHEEIDFEKLGQHGSLLHLAVTSPYPSIEVITYVLSLNKIDINQPQPNTFGSVLRSAVKSPHLNLNVIKLLINHGATVTIDDWLTIFERSSGTTNPLEFCACLDFFKDEYNWDIQTFTCDTYNGDVPLSKLQLPIFTFLRIFNFQYAAINYDPALFRLVTMYRSVISHYHVNINQFDNLHNTILHHLAMNDHIQLIQFTLLNSHNKPNIYHVNNKQETFLHLLISNTLKVSRNQILEARQSRSRILNQVDGETNISFDDPRLSFVPSHSVDDNLFNLIDTIIDYL